MYCAWRPGIAAVCAIISGLSAEKVAYQVPKSLETFAVVLVVAYPSAPIQFTYCAPG